MISLIIKIESRVDMPNSDIHLNDLTIFFLSGRKLTTTTTNHLTVH